MLAPRSNPGSTTETSPEKIELSEDEIPALPADRDWQGLNVVGRVKGSIDNVSGALHVRYPGISECYLEIGGNGDAEGYYPYQNVVFTRDDNRKSRSVAGCHLQAI